MIRKLQRKIRMWYNVYRRIRFFQDMYPFSSVLKDAVLFPVDYYLRKNKPVRSVRNLTIAVTHACNLRCRMCYFHEELSKPYQLPLSLYKKTVDELSHTKTCVILSGGEPFMHPDLLEMVAYAKKQRLPVQIFTNGVLVVPEKADELIRIGLDYIDFTLLGNEKSHNEVAGSPMAYNKLVSNVEYFAANRGSTHVLLNYTITPYSLKHIDHALELAERFDLDGVRFQHYNFLVPEEVVAHNAVMTKVFGGSGTIHEVKADEETVWMADYITDFQKKLVELQSKIPIQWAPTLDADEIRMWYSGARFRTMRKCMYPWRGILLDADGRLYPCSKIYLSLGQVGEECGVLDLWNDDQMLKFRANLKKGLFPACSRCCKL